ncbi:DUF4345 domain-containing protein [Limimaricola hongkongensis]|uniref:DUF4345 domain-containing protein n=1 Tax=Limimaricola hongkongensis DSM 17492 TaxID=1122180 RepID=A0A017HE44_9RHOB|nr:DUF4345 domain-containing protein [Limimaricola hongkongensis]EYD72797.1 hypothetical protein Lokhon_01602 [Limimaricola hongkongensis DSM 17492]
MSTTLFEKVALGASGLTTLAIGSFIVSAPHAFYASYGIALRQDASLLGEPRVPGTGLAGFDIFMLLGIWRRAILPISVAVALTAFLAFPAVRLVGLVLDGMPSGSVIAALIVEIAIAAFRRRLRQPASPPFAAYPMR